ncbi:hypothetical protein [Novosphingobium terrae]|uniref:hypothetical protein n=1 Tax=Novosphingobium terrae TaxID=2726189 RepID=UPI00198241B6|nr:hypothetical protein [Novosphingobium terrae]
MTQPEPQTAPPGTALYLLGMVAGFAVLLAVLLTLPFDRYIAAQRAAGSEMFHARWVYERIHFDPAPIDVAIIGSSRLESGISPGLLQQLLSAKLGRTVHVANLSVVQAGRDYHDLLVHDLLNAHPEVRLLVLTDDGFMVYSHPMFQEMASPGQIASAPLLVNKFYVSNLLAVPYRNLLNAAEQVAPGWFGVDRAFRPEAYLGTDLDRTLGYRLPDGHWRNGNATMPLAQMQARAQASLATQNRFTISHLPFLPEDMQLAIDHHYMQSIADLARQRHVALAFVGLPMFGPTDLPRNPRYFSRFGPDFLPTAWRNDAALYQDDTHLNRAGAILATHYLADRLAGLIPPPPARAPQQGPSHGR